MEKEFRSRNDRIFDIIVQSYIETAEPVGSRTISRRFDIGLSPASIRNVMADLEEQGLLAQPHTSAGRIPTDKGYRYWVDCLMQPEELSEVEKRWAREELESSKTIDALADRVSNIIFELTDNAAILYVKNLKRVSFLTNLLDELIEAKSEIFIEGIARMFEQPEFQDLKKMRLLLQAFDEKVDLLRILVQDLQTQGVQVHIGRETAMGNLDGVSLVVKDYYAGDIPIGGIAVVGPTRMKYSKAVTVVNFVADEVSEMMDRF